MNPQNIAITYNGLGKMEAAAVAVSTLGWAGVAEAVGRTASEMNPQAVAPTCLVLTSLAAAAPAYRTSLWFGLAATLHMTARRMHR